MSATETDTIPPETADLAAEREALLARLAELDEVLPDRQAGRYERWPELPVELDRQVDQAIATFEVVVRKVERLRSAQARLRFTTALDRAVADPEAGFARRLRGLRSGAVRELVAAGRSIPALAEELNLSEGRVWSLAHNNRRYVSEHRKAVLADLAAERRATSEARRATARADRAARDAAKAAAALAERIELGRGLLARIDGGEDRTALQAELSWSRQRLAQVLADARRAIQAEDAVVEDLPAAA